MLLTVSNALVLVGKCWKVRPDWIYLNSRISRIGFYRDFISILVLKLFYPFPLKIAFKSHGSDSTTFNRKSFLQSRINKYLLEKIDVWLVLSVDERLDLIDVVKRLNIEVIKNVVPDTPKKLSVNCVVNTENRLKIFFAGRLVREKGVFELIEGFQKFEFRDISELNIAGTGKEEELMKIRVKELGIKNVNFLGHLSESNLNELYREMDVLLFPSWDEGFSMVLFNAVSSGMSIITTKLRAAKDYLKEGENVIWIEKESPDDIAVKLSMIYSDVGLRQRMLKSNQSLGALFKKGVVSSEIHEILVRYLNFPKKK